MTWLASPLPGYLCDRVGCRVTNFIGGTLCVTGLVLTSFSHSLNLMYFTHTLVFGFGVCFIYNCSYLVIAQNFKENLSMATGIVALGASVGVLFTGPLLQVLLDSFGHVQSGGCMFHSCLHSEFNIQPQRTKNNTYQTS